MVVGLRMDALDGKASDAGRERRLGRPDRAGLGL